MLLCTLEFVQKSGSQSIVHRDSRLILGNRFFALDTRKSTPRPTKGLENLSVSATGFEPAIRSAYLEDFCRPSVLEEDRIAHFGFNAGRMSSLKFEAGPALVFELSCGISGPQLPSRAPGMRGLDSCVCAKTK